SSTRALRGWAYLLQDAARPALEDFEAVLAKDAQNADALAGRGNAQARLRHVKEALTDAEAALKIGPSTDRLLYNVACIYSLTIAHLNVEKRTNPDGKMLSRVALYETKALDCLR